MEKAPRDPNNFYYVHPISA